MVCRRHPRLVAALNSFMSSGWSWATLATHLDSLPIPAKHGWSWKRNFCQQQHRDFWIPEWASPLIEGKRHLGAALGLRSFVVSYLQKLNKLKEWTSSIQKLASIARTQPHAAYCTFTHGLASKLTYFLRTIPETSDVLQPLKEAVNLHFIPACSSWLEGAVLPPPRETSSLFLPVSVA